VSLILTEEEEALLRYIKKKNLKSLRKIKAKMKKYRWSDEKPMFDPETWNPVDYDLDWTEGDVAQKAKVGEAYTKYVRNVKVVIPKRKEEGPPRLPVEAKIVEEREEEYIATLSAGIEVWEVLQPTAIEFLPNKDWKTPRWVPKVKVDGKWIEASEIHFRSWKEIPEENKRVDFCVCVIPDGTIDLDHLKKSSKVLDELVKAFKKRKKK